MEIVDVNDNREYLGSQNKPLIRLWSHRSRKFLYTLLKYLPLESKGISIIRIVDPVVPCVVNLLNIKLRLKINLYDASIACLWKQLLEMGISHITIRMLVDTARLYLNHKTSYGRIIKILSYMRRGNISYIDSKAEILKYLVTFVNNLFQMKPIAMRCTKKSNSWRLKCNQDVKICIINEAKKVIMRLPEKQLIGVQKRVIAAALLYALLKHAFKIKITSADIENITGLSRFTILRRYRMYLRFIEVTKD